jgi:hypothetical protein
MEDIRYPKELPDYRPIVRRKPSRSLKRYDNDAETSHLLRVTSRSEEEEEEEEKLTLVLSQVSKLGVQHLSIFTEEIKNNNAYTRKTPE